MDTEIVQALGEGTRRCPVARVILGLALSTSAFQPVCMASNRVRRRFDYSDFGVRALRHSENQGA